MQATKRRERLSLQHWGHKKYSQQIKGMSFKLMPLRWPLPTDRPERTIIAFAAAWLASELTSAGGVNNPSKSSRRWRLETKSSRRFPTNSIFFLLCSASLLNAISSSSTILTTESIAMDNNRHKQVSMRGTGPSLEFLSWTVSEKKSHNAS